MSNVIIRSPSYIKHSAKRNFKRTNKYFILLRTKCIMYNTKTDEFLALIVTFNNEMKMKVNKHDIRLVHPRRQMRMYEIPIRYTTRLNFVITRSQH